MIKIDRLSCPSQLTETLKKELTEKFISTGEEVWKDYRISKYLIEQLMKMSVNKCSYCECKIGEESKYPTVEHIKPKSKDAYKHLVLEWNNLLIACQRCNSHKNDSESLIIDPCVDNPKEHLYMDLKEFYCRLYGKRTSVLGGNSVKCLYLNDYEKLRRIRINISEKIKERAEDICNRIQDTISKGNPLHYRQRQNLLDIMSEATKEYEYSATAATALLNLKKFKDTVEMLRQKEQWGKSLELRLIEVLRNCLDTEDETLIKEDAIL